MSKKYKFKNGDKVCKWNGTIGTVIKRSFKYIPFIYYVDFANCRGWFCDDELEPAYIPDEKKS